jgi:uncharacterized protein (TIGR03067 family)
MIAPRRARLALLLVALLVRTAPADDPPSDDLKRLEGTWDVVAAEEGGREFDTTMLVDQALAFSPDGAYRVLIRDEAVESGTFRLDSAIVPAGIDLKIQRGEDAGKTQLGIYRFDGNRLIVSFHKPGVESRPKTFKTAPDSAQFTFRLERRPRK